MEKLTDEERAWLKETESECRYDFPRKLVRIIDAQAAVIERLRDTVPCACPDTTIVSPGREQCPACGKSWTI